MPGKIKISRWWIMLATTAISSCLSSAIANPTDRNKPALAKRHLIRPEVQEIEITGEVVDAWCYASKVMGEGRGAEHKTCAVACVANGVSTGIVDDATGQLYIAAKSKAYQGCKDMLLPYVAKRVHVKAWLAENTGIKLLKIDSVEPISAVKPKKR